MKRTSLVLACLALALTTRAATPAPEKLLAADTLGLITVPDWSKARANFAASPQGQLWADPVMKPFRDKFVAKFTSDLLGVLFFAIAAGAAIQVVVEVGRYVARRAPGGLRSGWVSGGFLAGIGVMYLTGLLIG